MDRIVALLHLVAVQLCGEGGRGAERQRSRGVRAAGGLGQQGPRGGRCSGPGLDPWSRPTPTLTLMSNMKTSSSPNPNPNPNPNPSPNLTFASKH